jgi:hypothetical protein
MVHEVKERTFDDGISSLAKHTACPVLAGDDHRSGRSGHGERREAVLLRSVRDYGKSPKGKVNEQRRMRAKGGEEEEEVRMSERMRSKGRRDCEASKEREELSRRRRSSNGQDALHL